MKCKESKKNKNNENHNKISIFGEDYDKNDEENTKKKMWSLGIVSIKSPLIIMFCVYKSLKMNFFVWNSLNPFQLIFKKENEDEGVRIGIQLYLVKKKTKRKYK